MTSLARFLHTPAYRRAYSSFFSSKAGGGRYFNSAKPNNKSVPTSGAVKKNDSDRPSPSEPSANIAANGESQCGPGKQKDVVDTSTSRQATFVHSPLHPILDAQDLKLHQFFSLHRPLLLLSEPSSILAGAPPTSIFSLVNPSRVSDTKASPPNLFDHPPESSLEGDAEAARQLTYTLTMNRAGATADWEATLKRLGLDVTKEADRVGLQERLDQELDEVLMDSTKRKRRKKMKKHKLKKRRRATRSQRLKMR
ncbi:hypothetical protein VKT23_004343 [Stygiomarasmius scandens]|uniref:Small ribosomal subunit protein mS38 n=1 Tax=Marasmiellus scandens TaxID=2682957 RepID=A0ABR1JY64_9AGAR